jgi:hypothetical protein
LEPTGAPPDANASSRRRSIPGWLIGVLAVCLVIVLAAAAFAWTKAGTRDDAQQSHDRALQALQRERDALATAKRDLRNERHTVSLLEHTAQAPLASAQTGLPLLDQLLTDVQDLQTAGTNLGTPAAENAYNDVAARLRALAQPLTAALTPLPEQIAALRSALDGAGQT